MEIISKKYYFPEDIWQIIKNYALIYNLPLTLIPRYIKLSNTKIIKMAGFFNAYNNFDTIYKGLNKKELLKKILGGCFSRRPINHWSVKTREYLLKSAVEYMDRKGY